MFTHMYTHMHACMPSVNALSTFIVMTSLFCSPSCDVKMFIPFSVHWEHTLTLHDALLSEHAAFISICDRPRHRFFIEAPLPECGRAVCPVQVSFAVCVGLVGYVVGVAVREEATSGPGPALSFPQVSDGSWRQQGSESQCLGSAAGGPSLLQALREKETLLCWATLTCYCCVT